MNKIKARKLDKMLSKVGDTYFRRCITTIFKNLKVKDSDLVLDAGCGEGFYILLLASLYKCKIVGFDNDSKILKAAKKRTSGLTNITLDKYTILNLPYKDNSFDKIICSEVIEHINNDKKAISELYRVLKPKGTIVVTVPRSNYPLFWDPINKIRGYLRLGHFDPKNKYLGGMWSYDHKRLYSCDQIENLLKKQGFIIKKVQPLTRYSLPFNILILNLGKTFYTQLPVSETVKKSMEKFDWDKDDKNKSFSLTAWLIGKFKTLIFWIDTFNERDFSRDTATVGVCITATKK